MSQPSRFYEHAISQFTDSPPLDALNALRRDGIFIVRPYPRLKTLPKVWSEFLAAKPETGMGYQIVSVTLRDGSKVEDVAVIQGSAIGEVRGRDDIPFEPDQIADIELTHRKWKFRK